MSTHADTSSQLTTPFSLKLVIWASSKPRCSRNTSSVCCPKVGGGLLKPGLLSENFIGVLTNLIGPQSSWSTSMTMLRARVCSWFNVPWTSFTAAYGIPFPSKTSSHSFVVFCVEIFSISASSSSLFATLCELILNLGSSFHSGLPRPSHRMPNNRSFPPPNRTSPSFVLKALYGTIDATHVSQG